MKKDYSGALLLCVLLGGFSSAQEVVWQRDIPSSTQEFLSQITPTIDQQYLITGSSIHSDNSQPSFGSQKQNNGYDLRLMKLNQQGETVWEKYFSGNNHDFAASTVSTQDGGFAVLATSSSSKGLDKKEDSKGGSDFWLIRINEFGDELWQKTIGSAADEEAKAVIQTTDMGFFVAGNVQNSPKGYGSKDVLVVRLDKNGKELSRLVLGGKGLDEVEKMIPTKDGGALLGIYSRSNLGDSKKTENYGEGDYYIIKLDKNNKVLWEKTFGGKGDDHVRTLALTSTGYLIGGESGSERSGNKSVGIEDGTDLWLVAIDLNGNEQWQKSYSFKNRDVLMGMSVIAGKQEDGGVKSKGILLGGYTQAEGRIENDDETFWMLYLDQNGNEQWRKHVKGESRKKEERLSDIKLNRDGSIVLAGTSAEELGKENWKIVKLGDKQVDQLIEKQDIKIYPNPATDYVYVELGFESLREGAFEAEIAVYDMGGRKLETVKTKNKVTKINTQPLIQGAYLVVVKTSDKTANAKMIKK
ncbi:MULTISPECIES: T9SS type A sorting domain-containing protein [unclassified Chryseobacterium]|uniref:T9SS type A sorting domain-containing protein n=1 Tax=unclassified Chryseobacterium TaxID=2593645 RepID=UPI000D37BB7F|nr:MULTISPECIES: T9SS type A sorting domain-containing protein [unclassified Chryseobacterium]PTT76853.1 secretion protein [Chryseobacterium sp. HMWF001]PVV60694.1 T9SS C-terminal target domain-containing protein [Chryseobacterium sp. HMWF035]